MINDQPYVVTSDSPTELNATKQIVREWQPRLDALIGPPPTIYTHVQILEGATGKHTSSVGHCSRGEASCGPSHYYTSQSSSATKLPYNVPAVQDRESGTWRRHGRARERRAYWRSRALDGDGGRIKLDLSTASGGVTPELSLRQGQNGYELFKEIYETLGSDDYFASTREVLKKPVSQTGRQVLAAYKAAAADKLSMGRVFQKYIESYEPDSI